MANLGRPWPHLRQALSRFSQLASEAGLDELSEESGHANHGDGPLQGAPDAPLVANSYLTLIVTNSRDAFSPNELR